MEHPEPEYNTHHRVCKSWTRDRRGGSPIQVKKNFHDHWHAVFQDKNAYGVAEVCNKMISPEFELVVVRRCKNVGERQKTRRRVKKTSGRR